MAETLRPGQEEQQVGIFGSMHVRFQASRIPTQKTPDNREVSDGFASLFMSQKLTVSATHEHATNLRFVERRIYPAVGQTARVAAG